MSKAVKDLITNDLKKRLDGVEDALLVVKNSLARRAAEGTRLAPAFDSCQGTMALIWGGEDIISLAKEVISIAEDKNFEPFVPKGGVMDGQALAGDQIKAVSKWPNRTEQLSILSGQILSVGATLSGQLLSAGSKLASQIKKKSEEGGETAAS